MPMINPFNDISEISLPQQTNIAGQDYLSNVASIKIGNGAKAFKADESGIWLGGNKFADGVFSVDIDGNLVANAGNITGVVRIGTGTGTASITIDGTNKRILINDGTNNRVLLGFQSGGF